MRANRGPRFAGPSPAKGHDPAPIRGGLANLDTLRTFAVAAVLADHLILVLASGHPNTDVFRQFAMRLGRLGVVAFFVHTCVVLMFSLERLHATSRHPALSFYIRRAFRIYPLSIATVILVSILRVPELPFRPPCDACYAPWNVFLNLLLAQNAGGVSIIGPLWSLPYEVDMYLLLPALFLAASRPGAIRRVAVLMAGVMLLGALARRGRGALRFLDFVPCFLSGVLAFLLERRARARFPAAWWPAVILGVMGIGSAAAVRWWQAQIYIGWLASLILGASLFLFRDCANSAWNGVARRVSTYSYGVYLLHVPSLWIVFQVLGITSSWTGTALSLVLTAAASVAAYRAVEHPSIRAGAKWAETWRRDDGREFQGESKTRIIIAATTSAAATSAR